MQLNEFAVPPRTQMPTRHMNTVRLKHSVPVKRQLEIAISQR